MTPQSGPSKFGRLSRFVPFTIWPPRIQSASTLAMAPAGLAPTASLEKPGGPSPDNVATSGVASSCAASPAIAAAPSGCNAVPAAQLWLDLRCACGRSLRALPRRAAASITCACGAVLAVCRQGVADFAPAGAASSPIPLWWPQLMAEARRTHWRQAAERWLPPPLRDGACHPHRAACGDLLPLPPAARVLVLAAGLGGVAAPLARQFSVVAVEAAPQQAEFLALRAAQDGLDRLRVLRGDWRRLGLLPGQFDAIIAPPWGTPSLLPDPSDPQCGTPWAALRAARNLLAPAGVLYLAAPNRWALYRLRGPTRFRDAASASPTRAYSHFGYQRLFRRAGLRLQATFLCLPNHRFAQEMFPLHPAALAFRARHQPWHANHPLRAWLHRRCAHPWFWRALGGEFAFFLVPAPPRPGHAGTGCAPNGPPVAAASHPPPIPISRASFPPPNAPDSNA